ncbi:hypothetical protein DSM25559_1392 [Agrobacterium rosae]|uniref:Uncharacterized protein n=1 Tax=Agrobacterium rosae TaxID=1972867 RepID=A0A1R3TLX7_9HYPH|nr:hypothetical protein DSM25559_1392 [Agrobacterium rosae]
MSREILDKIYATDEPVERLRPTNRAITKIARKYGCCSRSEREVLTYIAKTMPFAGKTATVAADGRKTQSALHQCRNCWRALRDQLTQGSFLRNDLAAYKIWQQASIYFIRFSPWILVLR